MLAIFLNHYLIDISQFIGKKKHKNKKCTFTEIFLNSYIAMFVDKKEQFRKIQVNFHSAEMYAAKLKNTGKLKQNFQQYYSTEEL